MSKPFLENMSKEERQAFSYLETLVIKSKMECLAAIPKTQIYDDTEIKTQIQSHNSRLESIKNHNNLMHEIEKRLFLELRIQKMRNEIYDNILKQITILENSVEQIIDTKHWNMLVDERAKLIILLEQEEKNNQVLNDFIKNTPIDIALIQRKEG